VVGGTYTFGGYNWTVIDITNGQAVLMCQSFPIGKQIFSNGSTNQWYYCSLRTYLNSTFYNTFSSDDKSKIVTAAKITSGGAPNTSDNIWILSASEILGIGATINGSTTNNDGPQYSLFSGKSLSQLSSIIGAQEVWTRSYLDSGHMWEFDGVSKNFYGEAPTYTNCYVQPCILINP